jgi:hypothetical protein
MAIDGSIDLGDASGGGTPFVLEGEGVSGKIADGELTLPLYALEGATADGVSLPAFTLAAQGESGGAAAGDITLPFPTLEAGTAGVSLPAFVVAATGFPGVLVTGAVTLPAFVLSGALDGPLQLPAFTLAATAESGAVGQGALTLPAFTLAATGAPHVSITLPDFEVDATALVGQVGNGNVQPAAFTLQASAYQDATGTGAITLGLFRVDASGFASVVADGAVTLEPLALEAAALTGQVATADLTVPLFTLSAGGFFSVVGTASIELPAFVVAGTLGDGGQAVSHVALPVRTTVVLNTRLKGVTLYEGLAANSFANFAGVTLAATPDGIVALTGDDDLGVPIDAHMLAGISNLRADTLKQVQGAYVGYRAGGPLELTLITDEHHENVYRLEPRQGAGDLHASRVKFGRGVKGQFWQWRLANVDGCDFQLNDLRLAVQTLTRGV